MTPHDDVPAGRGRDELRERLATTLAALVALRDVVRDSGKLNGMEYDELGVQVNRAIAEAEAALAPQEARADDPETDGTDFAHPAYFRGRRDGILGAVDALERVLDHGRRGGTFGDERLQAFAERLDSLRAVPQGAREPEALRQTIAEAVEKLADSLCPAWRVGGYADGEYLAVVSTIDGLAGKLAAAGPAPEAREPELLGYVVERQLTTGEWMRVWRGSTMWFDHDEAVLDRDAYALDGIPARIRPVYLGAPAPERGLASATSEEGAGE